MKRPEKKVVLGEKMKTALFEYPITTYPKWCILIRIVWNFIRNDKSEILVWSWNGEKMVSFQGRQKIVALDL